MFSTSKINILHWAHLMKRFQLKIKFKNGDIIIIKIIISIISNANKWSI